MGETQTEKRFWRYWLGGLLLFAGLIALNPLLVNEFAPMGISDHQAAATAAKVDAIQRQWQADGVLWLAQVSMVIDLLFITVYSWGAWCGGHVMRASQAPSVRRLGVVIMIAAALFFVTDHTETISQLIQALQAKGSDTLASLAATVRPVKMLAWMVSFFGLLAALLFRRMARSAA